MHVLAKRKKVHCGLGMDRDSSSLPSYGFSPPMPLSSSRAAGNSAYVHLTSYHILIKNFIYEHVHLILTSRGAVHILYMNMFIYREKVAL